VLQDGIGFFGMIFGDREPSRGASPMPLPARNAHSRTLHLLIVKRAKTASAVMTA
jgi:hypothetical protein